MGAYLCDRCERALEELGPVAVLCDRLGKTEKALRAEGGPWTGAEVCPWYVGRGKEEAPMEDVGGMRVAKVLTGLDGPDAIECDGRLYTPRRRCRAEWCEDGFHCSECLDYIDERRNFCANCGAEIEVGRGPEARREEGPDGDDA